MKSDLFSIYVIDTETTGLSTDNDIIEFSAYRLNDDTQKTWLIKPINVEKIESDALRINGHKEEDILHKTAFGRENYLDPKQAIVEIENWLMEDGFPSTDRIIAGQNVSGFDKGMLVSLWNKCGSLETFPFSTRLLLDTMIIELFLNVCSNTKNEYYNLGGLVTKYGVKKEKAHRADADVRMTKDVLLKQIEFFKGK